MDVFLLRHGQTPGNAEKRYIGRTDEPLSDEGKAAASASGTFSDVKTVYISPMLRARQTAELLFPDAEKLVLNDLREMDFGDFEGRSAAEMVNDPAYRAWVDGQCLAPCPGGEDMEGFSRRVNEAFLSAVRDAEKRGEKTLVIVAHGGTVMSVLSHYDEPEHRYYAWFSENCRGWRCKLTHADGGIRLSDYAYMSELEFT